NPFSLNSTVTAGIISAKGRNINILRDRAAIESFIQTDAAVNPGNSGGALVNMDGELIGINTAIASPTGSYSGYAFAVPSNLMRKVIEDLMQHGVVQRGFLGINIRNVDGNLARENDLDLTEGVWVENVQENSAAADAGLIKGDVITAINGKNVKNVAELQSAIGTRRPGDAVSVDFTREGKSKVAEVVLKNKAGNTGVVEREESGLAQQLGAEFEDVDTETLDKLKLENGVRLKALMPGKLRSSTDIQEGFIITHIGGEAVKNVEQLEKILEKKKGGVMLEGRYEDYPGTQYYAFGL
ncbi:MAG: PDZ domain-containing protein, partial [Bacteroidota bacterium]